jgi:hypothetical protein
VDLLHAEPEVPRAKNPTFKGRDGVHSSPAYGKGTLSGPLAVSFRLLQRVSR